MEDYIYGWHAIIGKFVDYIGWLQDLSLLRHAPEISDLEKYWEQVEEKAAPQSKITSENWFSFSVDLNFAFHLFTEFGLKNKYIVIMMLKHKKHRHLMYSRV